MRRLEKHGLVERRQGSGTYLRRQLTDDLVREILGPDQQQRWPKRRVIARRTYRLAFLHDQRGTEPVFQQVYSGVMSEAESQGHEVIVGPSRPSFHGQVHEDFSPNVYQSDADGIIIWATIRPLDYRNLDRIPRPYALLLSPDPLANAIGIDRDAACRQGIGQLASEGHLRIAVLEKVYENKRPLLVRACDDLRETWDLPQLTYICGPDPAADLLKAFDSGSDDELPSAVFVSDDVYCIQVCRMFERADIQLGSDVQVISLANRGMDRALPRSVGRIEFDLEELGRLAVRRLDRRIRENGAPFPYIGLGAHFVPGEVSVPLVKA